MSNRGYFWGLTLGTALWVLIGAAGIAIAKAVGWIS